ncbi:MAG: hypothetical protein M3540_08385, partial [Actinomycetota bacterium]|nr:hypothetical protein [Actinomycetota bacterium]
FRNMVLTSRAVLEEARSEDEAAAVHYLEVADAWREYGFRLEQAEALLGAGRCLLVLERSDEAVPALEQAHGIFSELGAQPLLRDAADLLQKGGALGDVAAPGA